MICCINLGSSMDTTNKQKNRIKQQRPSKEDSILKKISFYSASVFGVGFFPYAPGTVGSLLGVLLAALLWGLGGALSGLRLLVIVTPLLLLVGFLVTKLALRYTGEDKDPSFIVIDEVVGQMLVFILPLVFFAGRVSLLIIFASGFVLFRIFDIAKPFHVGWVDKNVRGAMGVMLDDVMAAAYATVILCALLMVYYIILKTGVSPVGAG